ncbi:uncharacterized protein N7459_005671 [Penicillium hispanicum]|uniref:uncharacterized protein n=1 Tax=Penicillium hispanicum TaxID=1080232 RepID=UPI00253FD97E|nr:uncharacterized protein N7459_005671 [Penicillium hispanicum]KAJ5579686.1 hypothetical protein N7459_005671 [Penicillium hispanicum]
MADPVDALDPLNAETSPAAPKKRTRVQFSCTACRYRKLKCCRTYPCTNCKKRGEAATCTYVGRGPRGKAQHGRSSPTLVQDRLQHLENLVMSLAQKQKPNDQEPNFNAPPQEGLVGYDTPPSANDRENKPSPHDTGTLIVKDTGTSYIDGSNWRAILEEINGVREYIDEQEENEEEEGAEDDLDQESTPVLLLGMGKPVTKEELLVDIPPRSIADRLVSRFLKTSEPSLVVVHVPTFRKEYDKFWKDPTSASFNWVAFLYAIMTLAVSLCHRSEEPLPLSAVDPISLWNTFRKRAAQSLVQANYITPGRYKGEALFLYALSEFYRSQDAQAGVSYLLGINIRLAMRMGYHRDPSHFPNLSPYDCEMRRRLWTMLCQLDSLVSFQVGLPRTIHSNYSDTNMPANLLDTDFDEDTVQMPPARPDEERTACSYTRAKVRIMNIFGQTTDLAYSRADVPYEEIMDIDRELEEAHNLIPSFLKVRPMSHTIADPTELILRRYTLELVYQKTRIVLHRRYMAESSSQFSYSRSVCLSAARETLRYHAEIYNESLPGGQIYAERFFLNSLQNTDFMLSSMILCLELSQENERGYAALLKPQEKEDILRLLETTHRIFKDARRRSVDTQRAFVALNIMLKRVKGSSFESVTSTRTDEPAMHIDDKMAFQARPVSMDQQPYPVFTTATAEMPPTMYNPTESTPYPGLGVIEDMLNTPAQLNWRLYDSRVFGFETPVQDSLWYSGASSSSTGMDFTPYTSGA